MKTTSHVKISQKNDRQQSATPQLRFTPNTWAKLIFLRDAGETEVGGFGISSATDPLLIEDFQLVQQECDWASVVFDDEAVADYFDQQVDKGRQPEEFGRIWIHTHPGNSAQPSVTDEQTFKRVFDTNPWTVMLILARGGATYARLRFNVGPGGEQEIPVEIDFSQEFPGSDQADWQQEYERCVQPAISQTPEEPDEIIDPYADPFMVEDDLPWWSDENDPWSWEESESEVAYEL